MPGDRDPETQYTPIQTRDAHPETAEVAALLSPPEAADEIGRLGPYRVLRVLGAGGMGIVLLAEDRILQRRVALKILRPQLAALPSSRERFLREAQACAAIEHDHVVKIHQVGEERGIPFLALELLQGESLQARLGREGSQPAPWPVAEVVRVGRELASGLAAIHARGIVHRDVKPANVWLEKRQETDPPRLSAATLPEAPYRVKLLDFGLACPQDVRERLTATGAIMGTPGYLSPEQAHGQPVDPRTDLFSLGCILYRLATGREAFDGRDLHSLLRAVSEQPPVPLRQLNPALPSDLADLILQFLARRPADRPASARVVLEALAAMEESDGQAKTKSPAPKGGLPRRLVAAGIGLLLLLAAVLTWTFLHRVPAGHPVKEGAARTIGTFPPKEMAPGTIDLLALINPKEDAIEGPWRTEGGTLLTPKPTARWQRLMIPYQPPGLYDLKLVAERTANDGDGLHLGIVIGSHQAMVVLDGFDPVASGLEYLDGNWANANDSTYRGPPIYPVNQATTVLVQVRRDRVKVRCRDRTVIDWKGDPRRLTLPDVWKVRDRHSLLIGSGASFRILSLVLMPVAGE